MTEKCDTKQEILKTALKLFSAKGYESTSVAEIADAIGIRKASLYSRFTSKKEILDELEQEGLYSTTSTLFLLMLIGMIPHS